MDRPADSEAMVGGQGPFAPLGSTRCLVAALVVAAVAAAALFWLATWTLYDYMPPLEDTVGAVLAETSRGLFIASGLIAALVVLRVSHGLGRWLAERRVRG